MTTGGAIGRDWHQVRIRPLAARLSNVQTPAPRSSADGRSGAATGRPLSRAWTGSARRRASQRTCRWTRAALVVDAERDWRNDPESRGALDRARRTRRFWVERKARCQPLRPGSRAGAARKAYRRATGLVFVFGAAETSRVDAAPYGGVYTARAICQAPAHVLRATEWAAMGGRSHCPDVASACIIPTCAAACGNAEIVPCPPSVLVTWQAPDPGCVRLSICHSQPRNRLLGDARTWPGDVLHHARYAANTLSSRAGREAEHKDGISNVDAMVQGSGLTACRSRRASSVRTRTLPICGISNKRSQASLKCHLDTIDRTARPPPRPPQNACWAPSPSYGPARPIGLMQRELNPPREGAILRATDATVCRVVSPSRWRRSSGPDGASRITLLPSM